MIGYLNYWQTRKCIIEGCKNEAKYFIGHLHYNKDKIIAGFCEKHFLARYNVETNNKPVKNCSMPASCFGKWKREYGKEKNNIIVKVIDDEE